MLLERKAAAEGLVITSLLAVGSGVGSSRLGRILPARFDDGFGAVALFCSALLFLQ